MLAHSRASILLLLVSPLMLILICDCATLVDAGADADFFTDAVADADGDLRLCDAAWYLNALMMLIFSLIL